MQQKPRKMTETFLTWKELSISIVQGLVITAAILFVYQYSVKSGGNEETTRAMVFSTLIFANVFLSLVNRSFVYSVFDSFKYKNRLFPAILGATLVLLFAVLYIAPFAGFFHVNGLNIQDLGIAFFIAAISVFWFEGYKWMKRKN